MGVKTQRESTSRKILHWEKSRKSTIKEKEKISFYLDREAIISLFRGERTRRRREELPNVFHSGNEKRGEGTSLERLAVHEEVWGVRDNTT